MQAEVRGRPRGSSEAAQAVARPLQGCPTRRLAARPPCARGRAVRPPPCFPESGSFRLDILLDF